MKARLKTLTIGFVAVPLLLAGGVWAAQLNGLEIQPAGERVQVILETDGSQSYQIQPQGARQYNIVLPNARLPEAFRNTPLPTIRQADAGASADVEETRDGLQIRVKSPKVPEVRFKTPGPLSLKPPLPQSPLAAPGYKPPSPERIEDLFTSVRSALANDIAATEKAAALYKSARPSRPVRVGKASAGTAKPTRRQASRKARSLAVVAPQPAPVETINVPADNKPQAVTAKPEPPRTSAKPVPQADGYTLLQRETPEEPAAASAPVMEASAPAREKPAQTSEAEPEVAQKGPEEQIFQPEETYRETFRAAQQRKSSFSVLPAMLRWVAVAAGLVIGLLTVAVILARLLGRRGRRQTAESAQDMTDTFAEYETLSESIADPFAEDEFAVPPAPPVSEFFEQQAVLPAKPSAAPVPPVEPFVAQRQQPEPAPEKAMPSRVVADPVVPRATGQPTRPVPQTKTFVKPNHIQPPSQMDTPQPVPSRTVSAGGFLLRPAETLSDAIKGSLGPKDSPYLSAPFSVAARKKPVAGGPKLKNKANSPRQTANPASGNPQFRQVLGQNRP